MPLGCPQSVGLIKEACNASYICIEEPPEVRGERPGEAVVADEGLPDHKGELGVPQGIAGVVIDYCPTYDPMRKSIRRRDASKAARSKSEAQLKGVKARLEGLNPAYCPVIEVELMLS